jgi:hypothetical protein
MVFVAIEFVVEKKLHLDYLTGVEEDLPVSHLRPTAELENCL